VSFALLESGRVKAACKMMVKLTKGEEELHADHSGCRADQGRDGGEGREASTPTDRPRSVPCGAR